jgi:hypothetical protein
MGETRIRFAAAFFGLFFFLYHLIIAVSGIRTALSRDQRLESAGALVPGLSGLLMATAAWSPSRLLSLALVVVALPVLVLGRALYELAVFRPKKNGNR